MSDQYYERDSGFELEFTLLLGMVFLIVVGVFSLMFSFTYIRDLATLQNVPDILWDFACGRPVDNGIALPLLLTISIVSFLGTGILFGWRKWILRQPQPTVNDADVIDNG